MSPPLLPLLLCWSVASLLASPGQEPWGSPGSLGAGSLQPVDELYASGVDAYGRDDWPGVIRYMNLALRSARAVRAARLHCRRSCDGTNGTALPGDDAGGGAGGEGGAVPWPHAWDARFFGALLRRADCLRHCERVHLGGEPERHRVGEQLVEEFRRRAPYHYLQMAYFQTKALGRAAACAHTFHVANPGHVEMKKNLDFYRSTGAVPEHEFVDLEARPHLESLLKGARHYREERYEYAVEHVETALEELRVALAECRALCDAAPMAHEGYAYLDYSADLMQSLTDHYVQVLGCRQECGRELATRPGRQDPIDDFVPAHYNFLQYSYYKNGDYERAIASAASFLLFHPDDRTMQHNVDFYRSLHTHPAADIPPRQEALAFVRRSLMEKKMLHFASEVFGVPFVDPDGWTPAHIIPASLRVAQPASGEPGAAEGDAGGDAGGSKVGSKGGAAERDAEGDSARPSSAMDEIWSLVAERDDTGQGSALVAAGGAHTETPLREGGALGDAAVSVALDSTRLNGTQRVVLDGVISSQQCAELQQLILSVGTTGDGYIGKASPHTPNERFAGITIYKALKEGRVPLERARLYYDASERARRLISAYFLLHKPLHFSYTHLVCRESIAGRQKERDDLSHPVHVDNCLLNPESRDCFKQKPAYTHRDYSAILYLNDDFEGGDFIFTALDAETVTAAVSPRCGRLVAFSAGRENPHGVRAVTRGRRCALALWFTFDVASREKERVRAEDLMREMFSKEDALQQIRTEGEQQGGAQRDEL